MKIKLRKSSCSQRSLVGTFQKKTDLADPFFSKVGVGPTSETSPFRTGGLIVWTWTDWDLAWRTVDQADPFFLFPYQNRGGINDISFDQFSS